MELRNRKRNKDSKNQLLSWRCMACTNYKTIYQDSYFTLFRKPLKIVLAIIKCWSAQVISKTVDLINLHFEHNVHRNTVAVIFFRLRQLCTLSIDKKNLKLGGPGQIIEKDESLYAKVKHFKGKDLRRPQIWCFGLVERKNLQSHGKVYFEIVPNREAITLLPIIYDKVLAGSTIMSDCWSAYQKISRLRDFNHLTVNHTYNFLDPNSGACTNRIESLWNVSKHRFKDMRGAKRSDIQSHLDEFTWRFNNKLNNDRLACFNFILTVISKFYRPGSSLEEFEKAYDSVNGNPDKKACVHLVDIDEPDEEEKNEIESDCESLFGSLKGSDFGSENGSKMGDMDQINEDFNEEEGLDQVTCDVSETHTVPTKTQF
ncbi:unnamed protein product [Brachionus calyciflorus]|uniref:ISXO2-like transposase domain-containing protein n=1 Tax=Brachionus calyciflorus TaxID=104777 RepID=A0A814FEQ2_9BILA|nr:unnamed protein product [Brachionus calyciflorus]